MAAAKDADKALFVSAALVAVKTKGGAIKQLRRGDLVTEDVEKESVDLLKELSYVETGDQPAADDSK